LKSRRSRKLKWLASRAFHYTLFGIYKVTYSIYIRSRYRLRLTRDSDHGLKGPYLLLANHCNNFDGIFLQTLLSKPVNFVITDTVFKNRALGGLMKMIGFIPKKKFVSDIKAIKQIVRTAQHGGIVGIFPEGRRSWDGQTVHISESTYKLVRMLKVPVVTAKIKGAYLSEPRWADTKRRGLIEVEVKTLLSAEEIKKMSLAEIAAKVSEALNHNEFEWQHSHQIPFHGKALAKGLERLLFTCPECHKMGTLASEGEKVWCEACGAEYYLDQYGFIHSEKGHLPSQNISDINIWQRKLLRQSLARIKKSEVYLKDEGAHLFSTDSVENPYTKVDSGSLLLTKEQLKIGSTAFNTEDLYGISVNFKTHLHFRHKSRDYRVFFNNKRISVYKWYSALGFVIGNTEEA